MFHTLEHWYVAVKRFEWIAGMIIGAIVLVAILLFVAGTFIRAW